LIENHIVLLGATNDDADMHYSPFGRTAGTCIQAYAIQTLLEHQDMKEVNLFWTIFISFIIIVLIDVLQCEIARRTKKSKSIVIRNMFESSFIKNVINFICMAFLIWINFLIFVKLNILFNPTIMLMGIVLQVEGRLFYLTGINTYREIKAKKLKNSRNQN
jgi:CHASE2 domain-containing sensor protein